MKKNILLLSLLFIVQTAIGQSNPKEYTALIKKADSLYMATDYTNSGLSYSKAFTIKKAKSNKNEHYNAACSWALANLTDSSFVHLNTVVSKMNYTNYSHITADTDLNSLHNDLRWKSLIESIKQNKEKAERNFNKPLTAELDSIYKDDQQYRMQISGIDKKYGWESKEMKDHWKIINKKDSINLIKTTNILDKYGWLGADIVGEDGNKTLFLVIQHADLNTQLKYLPMMQKAAKKGNASGSNLALLEDRVALRQGRRQIYGSQIGRDKETKLYYVSPLEDPDNVDTRRANVGLQPLADYVTQWQIKWDVEQYKKDLLSIEIKEKTNK
jgi:hypothetical protein